MFDLLVPKNDQMCGAIRQAKRMAFRSEGRQCILMSSSCGSWKPATDRQPSVSHVAVPTCVPFWDKNELGLSS